VYKSFTEGKPLGGHFDSRCSEIEELETGIQNTKEKILKLKGHKTCESCKSIIGLEVRFCPNCGARVEEPAQNEKTE
jgi:rRNA maturation endonuclease Nob1